MRNDEVSNFATTTAKEAGKILMHYFGSELTKTIKTHANDFATEADMASEKYILSEIRQNFPQDSIVAEESGIHEAVNADYTWIIDPLDGTYRFSQGENDFGVMMTRAYGEDLERAVVFNPKLDILATAVKGEGVYLNGERVELDKVSGLDKKPLSVESDNQEQVKAVGLSVTNFGASANVLATLAGDRKAYVSSQGSVWDWAPPALILKEADRKSVV